MSERTLFILKPDAIVRKIVGKILDKIEHSGLLLQKLQMKMLTAEQASGLYEEHRDLPFYPDLVKYITRGGVICGVLEGDQAVKRLRDLIGSTNPQEAKEGTIRKEFGSSKAENTIHGSDSVASAEREIKILLG